MHLVDLGGMDALVDMADSVDNTEQPTSVLLSLNTLSSRVRRSYEVPNTSSLPSQNILCPHCDLVVTFKVILQFQNRKLDERPRKDRFRYHCKI